MHDGKAKTRRKWNIWYIHARGRCGRSKRGCRWRSMVYRPELFSSSRGWRGSGGSRWFGTWSDVSLLVVLLLLEGRAEGRGPQRVVATTTCIEAT